MYWYDRSHNLPAVNDKWFLDDLRYEFFNILIKEWPYPRSDSQVQKILDVTNSLVNKSVERTRRLLDEAIER